MSIELNEEGWDRTFFDLSSKCAEPICRTFEQLRFRLVAPFNEFDTYKSKVQEVAYRCFLSIAAVSTTLTGLLPVGLLTLGVASKVFRAIGMALQKNNYTYIKGEAPERNLDGSIKLFTWNVGGIGGGMQYDHCGVIPWRFRVDPIAQKIISTDADVVVVQEIYDTGFLEALLVKLKPHFPHIFAHLGMNLMSSVGGCLVLAKCPVHKFSNTSFENNSWDLNRTIAQIDVKERPDADLPCARILGTHLIHDSKEKRAVQIQQIKDQVSKERLRLPTILMGDLNIEKTNKDPSPKKEGPILDAFLKHSYDGNTPTETTELVKKWDPKNTEPSSSWIDYISSFDPAKDANKGLPVSDGEFEDVELVEAYNEKHNTRTALSDHNGIRATFRYR